MTSFRAGMETGFERFGELVFRHSVRTLLLVALLAGGLISQLPWIAFDTSTESFFHPDDPALIDYNAFREQFGRDQFIVIAVKPPDVFERAFLEKLKAFHDRLVEKVPHLKEVNSLINIRDTRGEGDTLVVEDLLKTLPATPQAMAALKKRVLSSNLYPNLIISEDGRFTTVLLETHAFSGAGGDGDDAADLTSGFDDEEAGGNETAGKEAGKKGAVEALPLLSDAENTAVIKAVEGVTKEFEGPRFRLFVAGAPAVTTYLKRAMQENMRRFVGLALLAIAVFLLILFRRLSGVFLPMLVVILSLASTVGLMSLTGVSFKLPLMILPTFLLAVGIGASVHLLVIFFRHYDREGNKAAALKYALGHSGLPILMTSITTAAGLLSFSTASLAAVADLGKFAAAGVGLSLVYTLAMVPALLALLPVRRGARSGRASGAAARPPLADRVLSGLGRFATTRPWAVLAASLLIVVGGSAGLVNLKFSHNNLLWFPADSPIRLSTELIDRELKGSVTVEMVIDTGKKGGLYEPAVLQAMERLERFAESYRDGTGRQLVGKTNSVAGVVKEIHRALNENREEFYRLPEKRELIAQELLLFENSGSDDLERLVDTGFSKARISIKTPWKDAATFVNFLADLGKQGETLFQGLAQVTPTGLLMLFNRSIFALMNSMVTSYTIAVSVITVLMILLIGRVGLGLLSMIPNIAPILVTLGFMGWMGIPLDTFTLLIGSIALGLAVDDTIHFFHNYLRYYQHDGDPRRAVQETLLTTGRAMLFTTLVLVTGFWLFMFATLNNLFYFGLLTGLALLLALLADLLLAPAMMTVAHRLGRGPSRR